MFFQPLELRTMLSATVDYDGQSTLTINGTTASDTIGVQMFETSNPVTRIWHVKLNGDDNAFDSVLITQVNIHGNGGNDHVRVDHLPSGAIAKVYGGNGNDNLAVTELGHGEIDFKAGGGSNTLEYSGTNLLGGSISPQTDYEITSTNVQWNGTPRVLFSDVSKLDFTGSAFNDQIKVLSVGASQSFNVDGQQGDDTIRVGNGKIATNIKGKLTIDGGSLYQAHAGDDTLVYDDSEGNGAIDTVGSASFNATGLKTPILSKFIDHQQLSGSPQNDFINVIGNSVKTLQLNSGAGNDVINVGSSAAGLGAVAGCAISVDGGSGNDLVDVTDAARVGATQYFIGANTFSRTGIVNWKLAHLERFDLSSGKSNNTIDASASAVPIVLHAGVGNDHVFGSVFSDVLFGGDGNDVIDGGAGDDLIKGESGKDSITGDQGLDSLSGGGGNDSIFAKDGEKDTYDGGSGNDIIKKDGVDVSKTIN